MTVTPEERDAMLRLRNIMEGVPSPKLNNVAPQVVSQNNVELAGPGQITDADINAMANVLEKLNNISNNVVSNMVVESSNNKQSAEILSTERNDAGVKVGRYQILTKEDLGRIAGKQFYSIYNTSTGDTIADDISLYETALSVIRLLNAGKFANDITIRKLFELDDSYTSHKVDAIRYKRRLVTCTDKSKVQIYESRLQASMDRCMTAKKSIRSMSKQVI